MLYPGWVVCVSMICVQVRLTVGYSVFLNNLCNVLFHIR